MDITSQTAIPDAIVYTKKRCINDWMTENIKKLTDD